MLYWIASRLNHTHCARNPTFQQYTCVQLMSRGWLNDVRAGLMSRRRRSSNQVALAYRCFHDFIPLFLLGVAFSSDIDCYKFQSFGWDVFSSFP